MTSFSPISNISIRTKLTLVFSVVLVIIAVFIYYFLPGRMATQNLEALRGKTESIASLTAYSLSAAVVFGDSLSANKALEYTSRDTNIVYIVVKDATGKIFVASHFETALLYRFEDEREAAATPGVDDIIARSTPITHNSLVIGHLYIGMSLAQLRDDLATSRLTILVLLFLVFLIGFLVVYVLTFLIVNPLSSMVETVGRISAGDLTQRAEVSSRDEVGRLAIAFNEMVANLAKAHHQLREANETLETRVLERTQQLGESEEALRKTGEQLRALSVHLQTIREQERAYISREIHDQLGQMLTAMNIDLAVVEKQLARLENSPAIVSVIEKVRYISAMVESTIQRMRRLALELRPDVLDKLGLVEALEWQAKEFEARTDIRCELSIQARPIVVDENRSIALFRMLQESLTNIVRHARASKVEIRLKETDGKIVLEVRDNGKGINDKDLQGVKSLGLIGMRERAAHLGGVVRLKGEPGSGTTVTVELPLSSSAS